MSIFREHKTIADRAAADRSRHRQKIEKAIKESIRDVLSRTQAAPPAGAVIIKFDAQGNRI